MLIIPDVLQSRIASESEEGYPEEICGVMIGVERGSDREVQEVKLLSNVMEENRARRYLIDPLELARTERDADARGLTVLGFYHSHPDHPPKPSPTDLEWAWPFYSYVIQAVEKGTAAAKHSWRLKDDEKEFEEEEISTK